jgi:hypothetical protein
LPDFAPAPQPQIVQVPIPVPMPQVPIPVPMAMEEMPDLYEGADDGDIDPELAQALGVGGAATYGEARMFHEIRNNPDWAEAPDMQTLSGTTLAGSETEEIPACAMSQCRVPPAFEA